MGRYFAARDLDLTVKRRWYLIINRTEARIYRGRPGVPFEFVFRMTNPMGRMKERDFESDRPGRSYSSVRGANIRHALDHRFVQHEKTAQRFCLRVSRKISLSSQAEEFTELVIMAEPKTLGILRDQLAGSVKRKVIAEIPQGFNAGSDESLYQSIQAHLVKAE